MNKNYLEIFYLASAFCSLFKRIPQKKKYYDTFIKTFDR